MLDFDKNSDELISGGFSSSKTSMSSDTTISHCTSFSRLSLDLPTISPENLLTLKPHRSSDYSFQAIRSQTRLSFRDFSLVRQIGSGDIEFEASHFSCVVMEYCSGGDLHSLRHKQPQKRFSLNSARFYAAEVLVALEYLHMLGIIYRDLKPENVLVRSDGHIMLTDFDLSLCSDSIPAIELPDFSSVDPPSSPTARILTPFSCISDRLRSKSFSNNRLFVAEPVAARSCSFVGTHEYVSPEVASGRSHGNAVDWWALGIFIYEMIYGRTPFAGVSNAATLRDIVKMPLTFPTGAPCSVREMHARDLISQLLNKDPNRRLGSKRGAADVKTHPFFKDLNFALIRSVTPPSLPGILNQRTTTSIYEKNLRSQKTPFDIF
ncbi:protein kinase PINOID-like isoform X2 [Olea europaea var. sylvestris]|uniref:protein kinase PINOID-like isoform X2 n=1 Tax=Olea europaea var. sylvestris TaxID=158386 RepID=UPI000C1D2EA3|nr:protein kinase PINOID-like isoform X2 [Olea europaea var. sylvestris]